MSGGKNTEGLRSVYDRSSEAYRLQRRHWQRKLLGHLAPERPKVRKKERKDRNDPGTDSV